MRFVEALLDGSLIRELGDVRGRDFLAGRTGEDRGAGDPPDRAGDEYRDEERNLAVTIMAIVRGASREGCLEALRLWFSEERAQ